MVKVIVSVISDLVTDQRVHKVSQTLNDIGYDVMLIGTQKKNSLPLFDRSYKTKRLPIFFQKGFLFYAEWNTRLFFYLLTKKSHILLANDLDTLLPNYLASKLSKRVLVYDTHEFFTETAELYNRPGVKKIWQSIEKIIFPKLKYVYTVNNTIADLYNKQYNKQLLVVRNVPVTKYPEKNPGDLVANKWGFPEEKKILLIQGRGLNENRGLEELILSAPLLDDGFILVIAGDGLIINQLKTIVTKSKQEQKVFFTGILPMEQLHLLTQKAFCGFSLDKPLNINQQASLPNKLFDYIAANIPIIVSNIKEVAAIVKQYAIGIVIDEVTPEKIALAVKMMAEDVQKYNTIKQNTFIAQKDLNWDKEKVIIETLFKKITELSNINIG
jgi:glycosyltransferase involved in cell wall biosynthesis